MNVEPLISRGSKTTSFNSALGQMQHRLHHPTAAEDATKLAAVDSLRDTAALGPISESDELAQTSGNLWSCRCDQYLTLLLPKLMATTEIWRDIDSEDYARSYSTGVVANCTSRRELAYASANTSEENR